VFVLEQRTPLNSIAVQSPMLPSLSQPVLLDTCSLDAGIITAVVQSANSPGCHPTVASSSIIAPNATVQQSPVIADNMALEPDSVTWSDEAGTMSHRPNESVHLIISAADGEETGNVNYMSAVTSVSVTSVSTCQQSCHTDVTEAESLAHPLSVSDHRQTEGTASPA